MFEQTSTSKLNADIKENMKARAKGVIKEGDTIIDGFSHLLLPYRLHLLLAFLLLPQYVRMLYYERQYVPFCWRMYVGILLHF
jgi:hypothetical protein